MEETQIEDLSFEQAYEQLERAVHQLEAGDLTLAESIALFERGKQLADLCDHLLNEAELRVRVLAPDGAGGFEAVPTEIWQPESAS